MALAVLFYCVFGRFSLAIHPNRTTIATGQCAGTKSDAQVSGSSGRETGSGHGRRDGEAETGGGRREMETRDSRRGHVRPEI